MDNGRWIPEIGNFFDDTNDIFGGFAVVEDDRQVQFAGKKELSPKHLLLLRFIGLIPIIIEPDLPNCHQFGPMGTDRLLDGLQGSLPIGFDIFGMESQSRKTIPRVLPADLQDGVNGRYIHSGYDHRFHASCTLTSNDLFTIGDKRLFIYVAMSIEHIGR